MFITIINAHRRVAVQERRAPRRPAVNKEMKYKLLINT